MLVAQLLGEGAAGLVEVGLGRALGAAEGVGDVGDAQVVEVVEGDGGGLAVRQAPDERPEPVDLGRRRVQLAPGRRPARGRAARRSGGGATRWPG